MACCGSVEEEKWSIEDQVDLTVAPLTDVEAKLLQESFNSSRAALTSLAVDLFDGLFNQFPDTAKLFSFMGGEVMATDWKNDPSFPRHVKKIVQAFHQLVTLSHDKEKLDAFIDKLEAYHLQFEGIQKSYFKVFIPNVYESIGRIQGKAFKGKQKKAWQKLLGYLYHRLTRQME